MYYSLKFTRELVLQAFMALLFVFLLVPLSAFAEGDNKQLVELAYELSIKPNDGCVSVVATLRGHGDRPILGLKREGLRQKVKVKAVKKANGAFVFSYDFAVQQSTFKNSLLPVMNQSFFTGFGNRMLTFPTVEGQEIERVTLKINAPKGWSIVTSRGVGDSWVLDGVKDLMGTLICAGDYFTAGFELPHKNSDKVTRVHVAIQGKYNWDEKQFVDDFKRLVRGQMDFFGGDHPVPIQFLALHVLPDGQRVRTPGFNRRAPDHDSVLAVHTAKISPKDFGFLGMLAHEHLHNWYPHTMKSDLGLWFTEGLTDYVAYRGLLANGLHDQTQFTSMLSQWFREYHYCIRTNDQNLMPYRRGMLAAWIFDIELRRATDGKHGLTDVLQNLIASKPAGGIVQRKHFVTMLKKISGKDMEQLYKSLVEDETTIDLAKHLDGTGFGISPKGAITINPKTTSEKKLFSAIMSE